MTFIDQTATTSTERLISGEININANINEVWKAWTTVEGIKSFFAPDCKIDIRVNGKYEILFLQNEKPGRKGSEDCIILGIEENKMLTFTWNAPPNFLLQEHKELLL